VNCREVVSIDNGRRQLRQWRRRRGVWWRRRRFE